MFLSPGGSVPHREASSRKRSLLAGTPPFSPGPDGPGRHCQHPVCVTHVKYSNINSYCVKLGDISPKNIGDLTEIYSKKTYFIN